MTVPSFTAFVLACLVMEITPGPNMGYLALLSATRGRRAGWAATAGVAVGLMTLGLLAALGLASLVHASPLLYHGLKWAGVAYFLWLAWDAGKTPSQTVAIHPDRRVATQGFFTNILNPKALLFYVTVLPGFIPAGSSVLLNGAILTGVYVLIATSIHACIVALAGVYPLTHAPRPMQRFWRAISAVMLIGIAVWIAIGI